MATTKVTTGGITDATIATDDLADSAVTYAKIENFGQNQVLGRVASGNGAATNLTAANVRTLINVEDGATADQTASEIKTLLQSDKLTNSEIADQTVTLDKLPHGTSSNDGKFLRANNGADPTFETVSSDLVNDTSPQLGGDLASNGNNITLGDSGSASDDRIVFGANTDMSIYHEPNNNYIDADTGTLHIRHSGEDGAKFIKNGAVELYHDNSKKIETTTNGATVTGTVAQTVLPSWSLRPNASSDIAGFPHSNMGHTIGWSANTTGASAKACHLSGGCTLGPFSGSPVGSGFNIGGSTVGKLTVPLAGKYSVWVKIRAEVAWSTGYLKMFVNGTQVASERTINFNSSDQRPHSLGPMVLDLAANDYIEIVIEANIPSNGFSGYNKKYNWFTGHYIG